LNVVQTIGNNFPQRLFRVDIGTALVNIRNLDRVTDFQVTGVNLFLSHNGFEQRSFTDTVWTNNADDAVWWHREAQVVDQGTTVETFGNVFGFDHLTTKTWSGWDLDFFKVQHTGLLGLIGHLFVAFQTSLLLGLATLGVGTYPFELIFKTAREFRVFLPLNCQTFLFLLQVGRVVAFIWVETTTVDLSNPFGNVIQEVTVVSNRNDGTMV